MWVDKVECTFSINKINVLALSKVKDKGKA